MAGMMKMPAGLSQWGSLAVWREACQEDNKNLFGTKEVAAAWLQPRLCVCVHIWTVCIYWRLT